MVLAILALVLAVILLTRDAEDGTATGSATPSPSSTVSALPSASEPASPSASAEGSEPGLAELEVLSEVEPIVEDVTLRQEPTTSGESIGTLAEGSQNIVIEGPTEADGYAWYRLAAIGLPPSSGCAGPQPTDPLECPVWFGWAAAGNLEEGEAWFEAIDPGCPDPDAETHGFMSLPQRVPLACYRDDEIAFTAWYPQAGGDGGAEPCDVDASIAWLYCDDTAEDDTTETVWPDESEATAFEWLIVDPESGVELPDRGQWLRITGAYDHPDSPACADANAQAGLHDSDALAVLECRVRFVVSAVEPTSAP